MSWGGWWTREGKGWQGQLCRTKWAAAALSDKRDGNQEGDGLMWPDQRLCDLFEIEHPIVQAPMLGTCTPALVSSVSNAGGMGSLACGWKPADVVRQETAAIRKQTNRSFCLNFFVVRSSDAGDDVPEHLCDRLRSWYGDLGLGDPPTRLPPPAADFGESAPCGF